MTNTLLEDILNGTSRYRCPDCGRWEYVGKAIRHSKRCDLTHLQPPEVVERRSIQAEADRLYGFSRKVKETGLCGGDHQTVAECVRAGLLSQSEAMNLDD